MKKPTQITTEQKKDLKALSRTPTEANKRRHRSGGTAQPGYATRYRPCAAQAPPSRRTAAQRFRVPLGAGRTWRDNLVRRTAGTAAPTMGLGATVV